MYVLLLSSPTTTPTMPPTTPTTSHDAHDAVVASIEGQHGDVTRRPRRHSRCTGGSEIATERMP